MKTLRTGATRGAVLSLLAVTVALTQLASCDGHIAIPIPDPAPTVASDSTRKVGPAVDPIYNQDGVGAFRTNCTESHYGYYDPIAYPGQQNVKHLHMFFGNRQMNFDTADPRDGTSSTCSGGTANLTGYWTPAMVTNTGTGATPKVIPSGFYDAPCSEPNPDDCERQWADNQDGIQVYYKTGYHGVLPPNITPFPAGLKIIAGNVPHDGVAPELDKVWWTCQDTPQIDGSLTKYPGIPPCAPGKIVQLAVRFPQCGSINATTGLPVLDSANHRSHMAYPLGWPDLGCPSSHPKAYPEITEFIRWQVPISDDPMLSDTSNWRMSSDRMAAVANMPEMNENPGWSAHADWWNGWEGGLEYGSVMQRVVSQCLNQGLDCQMNNIGDDPLVAGTLLERLLD